VTVVLDEHDVGSAVWSESACIKGSIRIAGTYMGRLVVVHSVVVPLADSSQVEGKSQAGSRCSPSRSMGMMDKRLQYNYICRSAGSKEEYLHSQTHKALRSHRPRRQALAHLSRC
jgi:hypothetical protein